MRDICEETKAFVYVCEAILARLPSEGLTHDDRDLIESSCLDLLSKLKQEVRTASS